MENGKNIYKEVKIDIIKLSVADIITTSGASTEVPDEEGGLWSPFV